MTMTFILTYLHIFNKMSADSADSGTTNFQEQTMISWSPRCYIPSFVEIGPPVPEKKIFEGFLPYMGMAAILVM